MLLFNFRVMIAFIACLRVDVLLTLNLIKIVRQESSVG